MNHHEQRVREREILPAPVFSILKAGATARIETKQRQPCDTGSLGATPVPYLLTPLPHWAQGCIKHSREGGTIMLTPLTS